MGKAVETNEYPNGFPATVLRISQTAILEFTIFFSLCILASVAILSDKCKMKERYATLLFLFSGPVLFTIERGNIILLSFALTLFFVTHYDSEKKCIRESAYIALGIAFAIKVYPAAYGALLLFDQGTSNNASKLIKRLAPALRTALYGMIFFFAPFAFYGGIEGLNGWLNGMTAFGNIDYGYKSYSVHNMVRLTCDILGIHMYEIVYLALLVIVIVAMLLVIFMSTDMCQRLLAITLLVIMVPTNSFKYVLIFLWIPFAEYLAELKGKMYSDLTVRDKLLGVFFLIMMIPTATCFVWQDILGWRALSLGQLVQYITIVVATVGLICGLVLERKRDAYLNRAGTPTTL